ncbi:MAG TPA: hypothetical protein VK629_00645, partial [Steroidobacteraceae bacterium]|nr:hypothetical protein [Steroidobacteraceae bacterium]
MLSKAMSMKVLVPMVALALFGNANAADEYAGKSSSSAQRYTFSWPLDGEGLKPRGGTTKGAPLQLDREPSAAWKSLQAANISTFERDRRAILA